MDGYNALAAYPDQPADIAPSSPLGYYWHASRRPRAHAEAVWRDLTALQGRYAALDAEREADARALASAAQAADEVRGAAARTQMRLLARPLAEVRAAVHRTQQALAEAELHAREHEATFQGVWARYLALRAEAVRALARGWAVPAGLQAELARLVAPGGP